MYIKLKKSNTAFRSVVLLEFFCPLRKDRSVVRVYAIAFCYDKKKHILFFIRRNCILLKVL